MDTNKQFDKIKECLCQKIKTMDNDAIVCLIQNICLKDKKKKCVRKNCIRCWEADIVKIIEIEDRCDKAVASAYSLYEKRYNSAIRSIRKYGSSIFDDNYVKQQDAIDWAEDMFQTSRYKLEHIRDKKLAKLGYHKKEKF